MENLFSCYNDAMLLTFLLAGLFVALSFCLGFILGIVYMKSVANAQSYARSPRNPLPTPSFYKKIATAITPDELADTSRIVSPSKRAAQSFNEIEGDL